MSFRRIRVKAARPLLTWYAATFAAVFLLVGVLVVVQGAPLTVIPRIFRQVFLDLAPKWPFWVTLVLPYGVFLWLRSVWRGCRRGGVRSIAGSLLVRLVLPVALVTVTYKSARFYAASERFDYAWDASVHNTTGHGIDRYHCPGGCRQVPIGLIGEPGKVGESLAIDFKVAPQQRYQRKLIEYQENDVGF